MLADAERLLVNQPKMPKVKGVCENKVKLILKQDVKGKGKAGEMVNVADGYARNFLLPKDLAVPATPENIAVMKKNEKERLKKLELDKAKANEVAESLKNVLVKITARGGVAEGETGSKLFGSITSKEIAEELQKQHGIEVEKNKIVQDEPIKSFGSFEIKCKLGFEIIGTIHILVVEK